MIKTIQKKFIVTAMIAITMLMVALLGALNLFNMLSSFKQTDMQLDSLTKTQMIPNIAPNGDFGFDNGSLVPAPKEDIKMPAVFYLAYIDKNGVITKIDTTHISSFTEEEAKNIMQIVLNSQKSEGKIESFQYKESKTPDGRGSVYVFLDISSQYVNIFRVLTLSILIGILCWLVMFVFVCFLSKKALKPIAANIERQKQFVTDAGHEIKTPLAIIMANSEALELHQGESKWSKNIREQTVRLTGLMQNLLALSKIDEINIAATKEPVNISTLVAEIGNMFSTSLEQKNLKYETAITADIIYSVNKDLFSRLCLILFDNAVKYSPENGTIVLHLLKQEKGFALTVANDCENLPDCPPEKLFDRFYRADLARTQKSGGYGIGLSAAKSIVDAHGGKISAEYVGTKGILFTVRL